MDPFASEDLYFAYALLQVAVILLLLRGLDLYEREPLSIVLGMFFWGAIGAAILASVGNELLGEALPRDVSVVYGPMISAPLVEEAAKGLALFAAFLVSRWAARRFGLFEFDGPTDGIIYGAAIGIGFAFTEDLYYFFQVAQATGDLGDAIGVYLDRRDFAGPAMLRHAIWTATFGAALGLATWSRRPSLTALYFVAGLLLAMAMHAVNNGLVNVVLAAKYGFDQTFDFLTVGVPLAAAEEMASTQRTAEDILGVVSWVYLGLFVAAVVGWLVVQRRIIARELAAEREEGSISEEEARLAPSFMARNRHYLALLRAGAADRLMLTTRMYGEIIDLAFARRRDESEERLASRRRSIAAHRRSLEELG
jgi:RsiW-degrading membrane proteinase PrsW (M82 family)